jgi:hypothetical protein
MEKACKVGERRGIVQKELKNQRTASSKEERGEGGEGGRREERARSQGVHCCYFCPTAKSTSTSLLQHTSRSSPLGSECTTMNHLSLSPRANSDSIGLEIRRTTGFRPWVYR